MAMVVDRRRLVNVYTKVCKIGCCSDGHAVVKAVRRKGIFIDEGNLGGANAGFEFAGSKDLESCSSTYEEELDPARPKYAEFNEESDI